MLLVEWLRKDCYLKLAERDLNVKFCNKKEMIENGIKLNWKIGICFRGQCTLFKNILVMLDSHIKLRTQYWKRGIESFCKKKLWFSNPYFFAIKCRRPEINCTGPINICFKYESCKPSDYKDICIRKFYCVAKSFKDLNFKVFQISFENKYKKKGSLK